MNDFIRNLYAAIDRLNWVILVFAGIFEILWAICLRLSDGWTKLIPTLATIPLGLLSAGCLAMAMRTIPLSTSYVVWIGIGAVGAVIMGAQYFGETMTFTKIFCIGLIITGIVGLKVIHFTTPPVP